MYFKLSLTSHQMVVNNLTLITYNELILLFHHIHDFLTDLK